MLEIIQATGLSVGIAFLILLAWGLRRGLQVKTKSIAEPRLKVSVLVAARNEERNLPRLLASLAAQDYPPELCEFIIINDGSTDSTTQIVRQWSGRDPRFRLEMLENAPVGKIGPKKRALAAGISVCRGDMILVTDADCSAGPGWITRMVDCFGDGVSAVCGSVKYNQLNSLPAHLAAFEGLVNTVLNAAVIGLGGALSCAGANFAYRREAFIHVGGFDQGGKSLSGDDDLLLQRFSRAGMKIRYCFSPQARIETEPPDDGGAYWSRKRRHLSAGRRYALHWIILAGLIYLGCLATILLGLSAMAGRNSDAGFLVWWGVFSLTLMVVFHLGLKAFGEKGWFRWSLLAAILFPLWFVIVHPLTLLASPVWKGRAGVSINNKVAA